jgi:hypothetical protein
MIELDRRQMLEGLGALIGLSALSASSCRCRQKASSSGCSTTALLVAVCDTLIPRTDTPGAVEVKVPATIRRLDARLGHPAHRAAHLAALTAIDTEARPRRASLSPADPAARKTVLAAYDARICRQPRYAALKDLLITSYYLSEPGATVELRYEHVPARGTLRSR